MHFTPDSSPSFHRKKKSPGITPYIPRTSMTPHRNSANFRFKPTTEFALNKKLYHSLSDSIEYSGEAPTESDFKHLSISQSPIHSQDRSSSSSRLSLTARTPKKSNIDRNSLRNFSKEEYQKTLIEFEQSLNPNNDFIIKYQSVASSLYELSVGIETRIHIVLKHILKFRDCAPLKHHKFETFVTLFDAGLACPPDCQYLLLTIPAFMISEGMTPSQEVLKQLIWREKHLLNPNIVFVTFGMRQIEPRKHIREMIKLFEGLLVDDLENEKNKISSLGTFYIEKFVKAEKETENTEKLENLNNCQNDPQEKSRILESKSIESFLNDARNLDERINDGEIIQVSMKPEEKEKIEKLAKKFVSWETAYYHVVEVWKIMKKDDNFKINVLLAMMPATFADFTIVGLKSFAEDEGIKIKELEPREVFHSDFVV
ncbi:hypothetical protein TRFO_19370 [Tritrichomonas foetus]|uniref:Uncharacterized protein n=1 Tax=Tritrichomonas foetus TaxID=1144522 RepID=A0A1J4KPB5_9EUKA|nr:hypothetical protein TRFO_19370 [Tritrichomonas foetus]|eukprot:OHT11269.1 hypothetical protein TRFO_19370 [Tritrichomonas foetus]